MPQKQKTIGVSLPIEAKEAMEKFCGRNRQSVSGMTRNIVLDYLREHKMWDDKEDKNAS